MVVKKDKTENALFTEEEIKEINFFIRTAPSITYGADPEFFIMDEINNRIISSEKMLPEKQIYCDSQNTVNCSSYTDGVQGEISPDASTCREIIINNIQKDFAITLQNIYMKMKEDQKKYYSFYTLKLLPLIKLNRDEVLSLSKKAKEFGCKPDFNTYEDGEANMVNISGSNHRFRYGGGHIHIGLSTGEYNYYVNSDYKQVPSSMSETSGIKKFTIRPMKEKAHNDKCITLVKLLDIFVGNDCVLFSRNNRDLERIRRKNYGKAGDYRITKYGVEYRTPSNFWLIHPAIVSLILAKVRIAVAIYAFGSDELHKKLFKIYSPERMKNIINNCDVEEAEKVYSELKPIIFIESKTCSWKNPYTLNRAPVIDKIIEMGVFKVFDEKTWIQNWGLSYIDKNMFNLNNRNPQYNQFITGSRYNGFLTAYGSIQNILKNHKNFERDDIISLEENNIDEGVEVLNEND